MITDLAFTLTTDSPLLINESDFEIGQRPEIALGNDKNLKPIITQASCRITNEERKMHHDKWMPFLSGFPTDSMFGALDISSGWTEKTFGLFQVGHLFSDQNELELLVNLSVITRRIVRFSKLFSRTASTKMVAAHQKFTEDFLELHASLLSYFESLPSKYRIWETLDSLLSEKYEDHFVNCLVKEGHRLNHQAIVINLLFFATLSILHQTNELKSSLVYEGAELETLNLGDFKISGNRIAKSLEILKLAYYGQLFILRKAYGSNPPSITQIPPSEIVASSLVPVLLVPCTMAMLLEKSTSVRMLEPRKPELELEQSALPSLESFILPVLDNIGQCWDSAYFHAANIRKVASNIRNKSMTLVVTPDLQTPLSSADFANIPLFSAPSLPSGGPMQGNNVSDRMELEDKSWDEIRNEFEDEFLL